MRRIAAADWFRVRPLADGVTWIDEPHVREFYRCNIWHLRGRDRDLLVDSGWGVVSLREHIPLVTERPLVAVASHTHFDHIAGHHEFPERWVHRAEADILARPTPGQHPGRPLCVTTRRSRRCRPCPTPRRPTARALRPRPACSTTATSSTSATGCSR